MRIGLIADIHGNAFALRAVLHALDELNVERIWCLGDIATPGPWPCDVVDMLADRSIPSVMGNTDQWLLSGDASTASDIPAMNANARWAVRMLGQQRLAGISELPLRRIIEFDTVTLALFHGSPRSTTEVISAATPRDSLQTMLNGIDASILVGGHTHVRMLRRIGTAEMVNPGSVGLGGTGPGTADLPPPRPSRGAEFAVLDATTERPVVSFHQVALDVPAMIDAAAGTGMPHLDWWSSLWAP